MSIRTPIFVPPRERDATGADTLGAYRAAIGSLPSSAEVARRPAGAVVVVDGRAAGGWLPEVGDALASGALGVVVDEAMPPAADALAGARAAAGVGLDVGAGVGATAGHPPVLVARRFLPGVLVDAVLALVGAQADVARLVTVEVRGAASSGVLRDALGWARALTGSSLVLANVRGDARGATALAESESGIPVTVSWRRGTGAAWLRVAALGATEVEVVVDPEVGVVRGAVRSVRGEQVVGPGYEEPARVELRRAIATVRASGQLRSECADLRHVLSDLELARQLGDAGPSNVCP
ncbi:hypothetical protein [Pseudoclavibacter terrae]|uniref:Uncharacterized protein n=1 Tax=Pseudoclavibacter terrae TaxID=1530195 RepID=A0A7J5B2H6_9MICO|nr:hypothetical protein [Pseudoclavibacter terrae]KAB1637214.1 hypothetical protein F8O03_13110 [Pseudoclavibacter terrae]